MKKFFVKLILFSVCFILSNIVYLELLKNFDWSFSKLIEIDAFKEKDYDYLILGNSLALDGFDMKILRDKNIHSFNLAIAGASIKSNYLQLENYLKNNKAPKHIIQGLSSHRNTNFDNEVVHPIVDYLYGKSKLNYKQIPMIKFKWLAAELLKKLVSKDHRSAEIFNGQFRTKKTIPDQSNHRFKMETIIKTEKYSNSKYLGKIDSICLEHHINLINIEMPGRKDTQNDAPIGPYQYTNRFGIKRSVYNLNSKEFCQIFDSNTDWLGDSHLNLSGSQKFTNTLFVINIAFNHY